MDALFLSPGPGIPAGLRIPETHLTEVFSRSSGPGGQGVNTTDSRVQLSIDVAAADVFTEKQRQRILSNLATRLDGTVLRVSVSTQRSQRQNRAEARRRLAELLRQAVAPPPPTRRATRPTRGSVRRRLEAKRRRSQIKATRRRPAAE